MIEANGLAKSYARGASVVPAVNGVDIHVDRGEFCVIQGTSGCGKTTLLYLLGGLLRPTDGEVIINGAAITCESQKRLAAIRLQTVGFVFQGFNLIESLTARENVELPMVATSMSGLERRRRAMELLESVGMAERCMHEPGRLSGGEQQRVAIARALANDPPILLADEPTGDLDTATGESVAALLKGLCESKKLAVVVVTHADYVARYASTLHTMRDGRFMTGGLSRAAE